MLEFLDYVFCSAHQTPLEKMNHKDWARRAWLQSKNTMVVTLIFGILANLFSSQAKYFSYAIQSLYSMQVVLLLLALGVIFVPPTAALRRMPHVGSRLQALSSIILSNAFDQTCVVQGAFIGLAIPAACQIDYTKVILVTMVIIITLIWYQYMAIMLARLQFAELRGRARKYRWWFFIGYFICVAGLVYAISIDKNFPH